MMPVAIPPALVLVIEDDDELRFEIQDALEQHGYEVIAVGDGREGLRQMRSRCPDVVVFDLKMPGMNGWEFRIEQRVDPALRHCPVVAMSASTEPNAAAVDADAFVSKPFTTAALVGAIEQVLEPPPDRTEDRPSGRMTSLRTLAAGVAHEINNPLTYVLLHLNRLIRLLPAADTGVDARALTLILGAIEGVERIRSVTRAVGTFAQASPDSGHAVVDVRGSLDAALRVADSGIRHCAQLDRTDGAMPFVAAAPGLLALALLDLLSEVVAALPDGDPDVDRIGITTGTDADGNAVIDIVDTRRGLAGPSRGPLVCQEIVRSLGGEVHVTTAAGAGGSCRVVLPAAGSATLSSTRP